MPHSISIETRRSKAQDVTLEPCFFEVSSAISFPLACAHEQFSLNYEVAHYATCHHDVFLMNKKDRNDS